MYTKYKKVIPLFLRLVSAASKIFFLMYLASLNNSGNLGDYALLMVVVGLVTQLLGVEINSELARRIHQRSGSFKTQLISAQFFFHGVTHILVLPGLFVLFEYLFHLGSGMSLIFSLLIVAEHMSVEIYRLLITLGRHEVASYFQFLRAVPYIVILMVLNFSRQIELTVALISCFWLLNTVIVIVVYALNNGVKVSALHIRMSRFLKIAKIMVVHARHYYYITCAGAAIAFMDKFILSITIGNEQMGVYYYIFTFATVISLWLSSTLGVVEGPRLIKKYYENTGASSSVNNRSLISKYIKNGVLMAIVVALAFWILSLVGFNKYISHFNLLLVLMTSTFLTSLADPVKLRLYLERQDTALLNIYVYSLATLVIGVLVLSSTHGLLGAGIAHLLSSATFLIGLFIRVSNKPSFFRMS